MGSSAWSYTVPYQADVAGALEQLRRDVYARGDYYRESPDPTAAMSEEEFRATLDPRHEESGINEALLEEWQAAQRRPQPTGPNTLLASQPHSGTHSIIDIHRGISAEPEMFTASPLTSEKLSEFFGTTTPTTRQVRGWIDDCGGSPGIRSGWIGTYVISYRDDRPDHIHFFGFSGD